MAKAHQAGWRGDLVLIGAFAANIGVAIAKFVAAGLTGSSSMLTEGVHSVTDSANQVLLLYGQHRAKRPPDRDHPFGYGRELYFWSFVVALLIFTVGAGVSVYEGYRHIIAPSPLEDATINYIVLGVATLMEGASWTIAWREFRAGQPGLRVWAAIRASKDPALFITLFEDSAAIAGLAIASLGVWSSHYFNDSRLDGVASIVIGAMLGAVALVLARESKGLLIGERADLDVVRQVRDLLAAEPAITHVNHVRTIHTAPDKVFVAISADFRDDLSMGEGELLIEALEVKLRRAEPKLTAIYIRPERAVDAEAERRRVMEG